MRFFYQEKLPSAGAKSNPLFTAVSTYMKSIDMGDYNPMLPAANWSSEDESICILQLLKNASQHFEEIDFPEDPAVSYELENCVPQIAHLLASLTILKECFLVAPPERLEKLEKMGVLAQVKAGMPGPSMVYIDALLDPASMYDDISKITLLTGIIADLKDKGDKFGALNYVLLSVALTKWNSLIDKLEPHDRALFSDDKRTNHTLQAKILLKSNSANMTFIDQCILTVWEKLELKVGLEDAISLMDRSRPKISSSKENRGC